MCYRPGMAFEKYSASGILLYAVPLYAAPILAGASAAPWAAVLVFAALFSALILKTRPLPDDPATLIVTLIFTLTLHAGLTAGLFGLGRGIALLTGPIGVPIWGTLLLAVGAVGLGIWRYRWTPERAETEALLDEALSELVRLTSEDKDSAGQD